MVYDITSAKSFENLMQWHTDFISKAGPKDSQNFPFFLFGNKCDRVDDRKVSQDTVNKWTKMNNNIPYEETSAINGRNIEESFMKIAKHLLLHQLSTQENQLL